ncbi:MAG TPA: MBL fold metallo-hydrolase [Aldersonia sp.]
MMQLTHVGGPTVLIELDGWRILTDPTFDPPGRRYTFGWGTASRKLTGPALAAAETAPLDAILLSHDHHADNLDDAGRDLLPRATTVLTTRAGARRLHAGNVRGLAAGDTVTLDAPGRPSLIVTATPCRHGPRFSRPLAGAVVGFAIRRAGEDRCAVWMTGDTVYYPAVRNVARRLDVAVALLHVGGVGFGLTGPVRYSMRGSDALRLLDDLQPRLVVPVHYEGWSHFREPAARLHEVLDNSDPRNRIRWLVPGHPAVLDG